MSASQFATNDERRSHDDSGELMDALRLSRALVAGLSNPDRGAA